MLKERGAAGGNNSDLRHPNKMGFASTLMLMPHHFRQTLKEQHEKNTPTEHGC